MPGDTGGLGTVRRLEPVGRLGMVRVHVERAKPALEDAPVELADPKILAWPKPLFPFQVEGAATLVRSNELLLADEMGLGKTIECIAAIRVLHRRGSLRRCLIVVPASVVFQWRRELRLWAPELTLSTVRGPVDEREFRWKTNADVYLVSYETLRSDCGGAGGPDKIEWDLVVLDEAQKIKNRDVEVSAVCKALRRARSWALTGTPLENSVEDLESILEFVTVEEMQAYRQSLGAMDLSRIHRRVQLRRKKSEVLKDLPPRTSIELSMQLGRAQRAAYDRAEKEGIVELRSLGARLRIEHVLELIVRLKQICNFCPSTGDSVKLDDLEERLTALVASGNRALVFTQYVGEDFGVAALCNRLRGLRALPFTGSMSQIDRDRNIRTFKESPDHRILVLSLRAGGLGLNLQQASYVFHFDRWWNPAVEEQATGRAHRFGQKLPVHVYTYVCEQTIEDRIKQILEQKRDLFAALVDDVSVDLKSTLNEREMFGLFGLQPPERGRR